MNPADQPPFSPAQRAAESPTLWLSLALGSVLIHLVLFILASLAFNQSAKVQLAIEPIAVEFVDPNAVRSTAAGRAIAVRPGKPSSSTSFSTQVHTQVQPRPARSQPSAFNQPVEQPFVPQQIPQQIVKRRQTPARPQPQPPDRPTAPTQPQLNASDNSRPQPPNLPNQPQGQSASGGNPSGGGSPGSTSNASNDVEPTTSQSPAASGNQIAQSPQGRDVTVVVSNPQQTKFDPQQQSAKPIERQRTLSIDYPDAITQVSGHILRLEVTLRINDKGEVVGIEKPSLLSPVNTAIDPEDLDSIAKKIFENWKFEPAQNRQGNAVLKPLESNLTIEAKVQLP